VATIAKLETIPLIYRLPAGRAYGMARGLTSIRQASLVKLTTDEGVEGIGEAWGPPSVTKAYLDLIASYFIGHEVYGFEHATSAILSTYYHFGIQNQMTSCLSGIDIACLDAIGKIHGLPVVKLLGGPARDRLPIYAWRLTTASIRMLPGPYGGTRRVARFTLAGQNAGCRLYPWLPSRADSAVLNES
jgi:D-galactarolactone cycloisomerase